jgi:hypothetical protein
MHVADIGCADDVEIFGLELLLQVDGDQALQDLLPDIAGELLANDRGGRFSRAEARQFGPFLHVENDAVRLAFDFSCRDGDFERVLATFN